MDAAVLVDELREQMTTEPTLLNNRMPKLVVEFDEHDGDQP
ncbi:hypothetical protein ACFWJ4_34780 [Kitasatospora sp. NPDC127067]